jgi:hypothetical protein
VHAKEKGKDILDVSAHEDVEDSSDSEYDDVHEAGSVDSSVDDEEAICYREQALELKKIVKTRMLGEKEQKSSKMQEEFIFYEVHCFKHTMLCVKLTQKLAAKCSRIAQN